MTTPLSSIIVCPQCKGSLVQHPKNSEWVCLPCALAYEIKSGIPVMIAKKARKLSVDEVTEIRKSVPKVCQD